MGNRGRKVRVSLNWSFLALPILLYAMGPASALGKDAVSPASCHRAGLYAYFLKDKPGVVDATTPNQYMVREGEFYATAALDDDGYIVMGLSLKALDGSSHAKFLRGKEELYRILKHFEGRAKGVKGVWLDGDNYAEYHRLTRPPFNLTPAEAARRTWTGGTLVNEGYVVRRVREIGVAPVGEYPIVEAVFELP